MDSGTPGRMRHLLVNRQQPEGSQTAASNSVVPVTWQPRLDDGMLPSQRSNCAPEKASTAHLQRAGRTAWTRASHRSEGNLTTPSMQTDPHSETAANDGGGAARPIRRRRAVCWLEAIWLGRFLVASQRRDTLLDLTGGQLACCHFNEALAGR
jgi:hypothetical protein